MLVHSLLGYKDAVKSVYERKLVEARTEAQQDPQYLLHGDVSKYFFHKIWAQFSLCLTIDIFILRHLEAADTELSVQTPSIAM